MGESKCVLRAYVYNEFTKSTMFKNTIISSTKTEYQKEIDRWINYIKSCGNTVENYQPPKPKKVVSDKQNARNKANKEYHRIVNNISNSRVRGNKKKEIYWTEKLQELKNGGTI